MINLSESHLQRSGLMAILASAIMALLGYLLPGDSLINPAFIVGIAFVLALFGLFAVLRPYVPKKLAFIGAVTSYIAMVASAIVALNYNDEVVALGGYAIGFISFLAILAKLFLLLGVSHVIFPGKADTEEQ
ncbi:MAG: hypothetical protein JJU41_00915 [Bacteroidetes bacterium]|nr:hypothetical protein [Bacteroidota bacterium]